MYVGWDVTYISYGSKCYYGRLWKFILWYTHCIYIHDVYMHWIIPCISYSSKCYYGRLWDFIWWYTVMMWRYIELFLVSVIAPNAAMVVYGISSGGIHLVFISMMCMYTHWNVPYICYSPKCCYVKGKEVFYLTTHSTHFIYGYMASDIW